MRTQGILLVRDATLVLNSSPANCEIGLNVSFWVATDSDYIQVGSGEIHQLALVLDRFSCSLMENLERFIEIEDSSGVETVWTCCVTCLGHLAALCHFISRAVPTLRGSMDDLCNLALDRLTSLSHEVRIEGYSYFDVLTAVRILARLPWMNEPLTKNANQISWRRALDTINVYIGSLPHAKSEQLRHWKGVIEKAHADLHANLLCHGPSSLFLSYDLSAGSWKGGLNYPILILEEEREDSGF